MPLLDEYVSDQEEVTRPAERRTPHNPRPDRDIDPLVTNLERRPESRDHDWLQSDFDIDNNKTVEYA